MENKFTKLFSGLLIFIVVFILSATTTNAQIKSTINPQNNPTTELPLNTYYGRSYTQQIYTAAEILAGGGITADIVSVGFQYFYDVPQTKNPVTIYMGLTNTANFPATPDFIPVSSLTQVYYGSVDFENTATDYWVDIPLSTPFAWDGTSNIVVAVLNNHGTYTTSSNNTFYRHSTSDYMTVHYRADGSTVLDPNTLTTITGRLNTRSNIRFSFQCQDFDIDITSTSPAISNPETVNISSTVTFNAQGTYPNNNQHYLQTDANVTWTWTITTPDGEEEMSGVGMNTITYTFTEAGTYTISLTGSDISTCTAEMQNSWVINVTDELILDGILTGQAITTCTGRIHDSGGASGNYQNNEDYSLTLCSNFTGSRLQLDFSQFDVGAGDYLTIYDGIGTSGTVLLNQATGIAIPASVTSHGECLTLVWHSDGSGTGQGFTADISCISPPCQDYTIDIVSTTPSLVLSGYSVAQGTSVLFNASGTFPNNNTPYLQSNQNLYWEWTISNGVTTNNYNGTGLSDITHLFNTPGTFTVTLTTTDPNGCISSITSFDIEVGAILILNSTTSGTTVNTCSGKLYDSGGPDANYENNENYNITICSAIPGASVIIDVLEFTTESASYDWMYIYDGTDVNAPIIVNKAGGTTINPQYIESTGECLHITWRTDGSGVRSGFELNISCGMPCQDYTASITDITPNLPSPAEFNINTQITFTAQGVYPNSGDYYSQSDAEVNWEWTIDTPSGQETEGSLGSNILNYTFDQEGTYTITLVATDNNDCVFNVETWTCNVMPVYHVDDFNDGITVNNCHGFVYDSGGENGNYGDNEDYTLTVCSNYTGSTIQLDFTEFDVLSGDYLTIYDGTGTSGTILLNQATGNTLPGLITASYECMTLEWHSDASGNGIGFTAEISCIAPNCQDFNIDITNTSPSLPSVGYIINQGTTVDFTATGTYPNNNSPYFQNDAITSWKWEFVNGSIHDIIEGAGMNTTSYTFNASGTYTVTLTAMDDNGCPSTETITFDITINPIIILDGTTSGTTATTCGAVLYDSGGPTSDYANNENYNITICSAIPGASVIIDVLAFNTESASFDWMYIYDGTDVNAPIIVNKAGGTTISPQYIESTGECLHITWRTDGSSVRSGFELNISCGMPCQDYTASITDITPNLPSPAEFNINTQITFTAQGVYPNSGDYYSQSDAEVNWEWTIDTPSGQETEGGLGSNILNYTFDQEGAYTITLVATDENDCVLNVDTWTCNVMPVYHVDDINDGITVNNCHGFIYDSGGETGNYGDNEDNTLTICSNFPGSIVQLDFSLFDVSTGDYLTIYDGTGTSGTVLVNQATGSTLPGIVTATAACLTLEFHSNGSGNGQGFAAEISCIAPDCQDFNIAVTNTSPSLPSVSYTIDQGTTVDFTATGTYPNNNSPYQQSDAITYWKWEFLNGPINDVIEGAGNNNVSYTFSNSGTYTVILTAIDDNNCPSTDTVTFDININPVLILNSSLSGSTVYSCNAILYDSGGPTGDYGNNEDYNVTICSSIPTANMILDFISFNSESTTLDFMNIYDGTNTSAPLLRGAIGGATVGTPLIEATGECVHITWRTDGSVVRSGFAIQLDCGVPCQEFTMDITDITPNFPSPAEININTSVTFTAEGLYPNSGDFYTQSDAEVDWTWTVNTPEDQETYGGMGINYLNYIFDQEGTYTITVTATDSNDCSVTATSWTCVVVPVYLVDNDNNGLTVNNCHGYIYDSGGENGQYGNNEDYTLTVCSNFPGSLVQVNFTEFDVAPGDHLSIYNGTGTTGTRLLNQANGTVSPGIITATDVCMTLVWHSNSSTTADGFTGEISCVSPPCQEFSVIISNTSPSIPGSGYVVNQWANVSFTATGSYPNNHSPYEQNNSTTTWRWEFINTAEGVHDVIEGLGQNIVQYSFNEEGTYTIILTAIDVNGCPSSNSVTYEVTINPILRLDAGLSGTTVNTCGVVLYDSGGPTGDYSNNENYNVTFCSTDPAATMTIDILEFNSESTYYDYMYIYDGNTSIGTTILANQLGGSTVGTPHFETTGQCVHITWRSNASTVRSGFALQVGCKYPCQEINLGTITTDPPYRTEDDIRYIDICQGQSITFSATGIYPQSGTNYEQSDEMSRFIWSFGDGEIGTGNPVTYSYNETRGYEVGLRINDQQNCSSGLHNLNMRIRISTTPVFSGTSLSPEIICPGETIYFNNVLETIRAEMPYGASRADTTFLPDGSGVAYYSDLTFSNFGAGQTVSSIDDIQNILLNMEHSYLGDLSISIICPNGQVCLLKAYSTGSPRGNGNTTPVTQINVNGSVGGGGTHLGWAPDPGTTDPCYLTPGEGLDYWFTPNSTTPMGNGGPTTNVTYVDPCGNSQNWAQLNSGEYGSYESMETLIGCPLNGTWTIEVTDNLASDNGFIFSWGIEFAPYVYPVAWGYQPEVNPNEGQGGMQWIGENVTGFIATPVTSGDRPYTFRVTDDFGCSYDTVLYVHVRQAEDSVCCIWPDTYAGPDDQVCSNTYIFNASLNDGNVGRWEVLSQPAGSGTPVFSSNNARNAQVTVNGWGEYQFIWTEINGNESCFDKDTVNIKFYPVPTTTFTYTPIDCYQNTTTIQYIGNVDQFATYNWDFNGGVIVSGNGQGPYEIYWNNSGIRTVNLQVNANGCQSADTTVNIMNPEILSQTITTFNDPCFQSCGGSAQVIPAGGTPPYSYSWASGTNTISNLCANNYSLTVTDNNGCTSSQDFIITEPPQLVITDTTYTDLSCYNSQDGTISITTSGGTGNLTYNWSDIGVGSSSRVGLAARHYEVLIVDENGCSISERFTLTQPEELLVSISPDAAICQGQQTIIQTHTVGGTLNYNYHWSNNTAPVNNSSITVTPDTTTRYSVYVEDAHGCISNTATANVVVSPLMVIDSMILKHNNCYQSCDGRAEVSMRGGIPPFQYTWESDNHIARNLCSGTYHLVVTDVLGCNVSTSFVIEQPPQLTYTTTTEPATCYGASDGTASIFVQGGTPSYTYLWPDGTSTPTITTRAGSYTVTVLDNNNCRLTADFTIEEPTEIKVLPMTDRTICRGQSTILSTQVTGGMAPYEFRWNDGTSDVYFANNYEVSPEEETIYSVVITDANGCETNPMRVKVSLNPELRIISAISNRDLICPGDSALISVQVTGGNGGPYRLTLQDGTIVDANFHVYPTVSTTYLITLSDMCGTTPVRDSVRINVRPTPLSNFGSSIYEGCPPLSVTFNDQSSSVFHSYTWRFGDNLYSENRNPVHVYTTPGNYHVSLEVSDEYGCRHSKTVNNMIRVLPTPKALFEVNPEIVTMHNAEAEFINYSVGAVNYYWTFGDGDSSTFQNPRHYYTGNGEYEVMLIAENEHFCRDSVTRILKVENDFSFFVPTAFTPNGDGQNDCFRPCGNGISSNNYEFKILDRWGNVVYHTYYYTADAPCDACTEGSWDGTMNSNSENKSSMAPNGVYTWYCTFEDWNGIQHTEQGTILLIK